MEINTKYAALWPNIADKKEPPPDAETFNGLENKFAEHFSAAAAKESVT